MKGKKTGGRAKGTPNKTTTEIGRFCRSLVNDREYRKQFKTRWRKGELPPAVECLIWHYGYGKPKETHAHEGPDGGPVAHHVTFEVVGA